MSAKNTRPYQPENIPLYDRKAVFDERGHVIPDFVRIVEAVPNGRTVSVMSDDYQLVQHRTVAAIAHGVMATLDKPDAEVLARRQGVARHYSHYDPVPAETVSLFHGGKSMEYAAVVGGKYKLANGEEFYPGLRILNSLDGRVAVAAQGFALRLTCLNTTWAPGIRGFTGFSTGSLREVHVQNEDEILGQVERAIHEFLDAFPAALDLYSQAMNDTIRAGDVEPALVERGLPELHASRIGRAAMEVSNDEGSDLLTRWDAYQEATHYLTYEVKVAADRQRSFERHAAAALLLDGKRADQVSARKEARAIA